jgi:hypothetical protein
LVTHPGVAWDVPHAEFAFDVGEDPHPGQEWILNKDFDLHGQSIRLVSITVNARQGYVFHLQSDDSDAGDVAVEIVGHPSISVAGSGSWDGGRIPVWDSTIELDYHLSLLLPKGRLRIVVSSSAAVPGESRTDQFLWSPDALPVTTLAMPTP